MRTISIALLPAVLVLLFAGVPAGPAGAVMDDPPPVFEPPLAADYVLVEKAKRRLTLWRDRRVIREYEIRLGRNPEGPKLRSGDGRTPEGLYWIDGRNPDSAYHLSLHISYPEPMDVVQAREAGADPGDAIVIHGLPDGVRNALRVHRLTDWTEGCIAVTNAEIEEIWQLVPDGTPIEIQP